MAGIEADGRDGGRFGIPRRKQQRADGRVEIELRDQRHALLVRDGKRQRDLDAVDFHVMRIHVKNQPGRAVRGDHFVAALEPGAMQAVRARPIPNRHIILAVEAKGLELVRRGMDQHQSHTIKKAIRKKISR